MSRFLILGYGSLSYLLFFGVFLYAVAFVGNFPGDLKTIDSGVSSDLWSAIAIDIALLALFAVQHSVMARRGFKAWWTKIVPPAAERSTFVLAAAAALALLFWQWRPILDPVWTVTNHRAVAAIELVFWAGWGLLFVSTFLINHFELFGLQQVLENFRRTRAREPEFKTPGVYRYVRHPIYLGFVLAFWATPTMSVGHLLFAIMTTGYILVGIFFEERDLVAQFGDRYRRYRTEAGMLMPRFGAKEASRPTTPQRTTS
jgi:protein-S-isoprenylcysteine O-methyltransferase Ste14